jgi:hypothetical protein
VTEFLHRAPQRRHREPQRGKSKNKMDNWNGIGSLLIACVELILLINLLVFAEKNKFNFRYF